MKARTLKEWRERLGLNRSDAAEALGIDRKTFARYEDDASVIPLYIALAAAAVAAGLPPLSP